MCFYCIRQIQTVSLCSDLFPDLIWSMTFIVQLWGRSMCPNLFGVQPNFITDLEGGSWESASVSIFLLPFLHITHLGSKVFIKFCHSDNERSRLLVVSRESLFVEKVHPRIIAVVGKEGTGAARFGCMIVPHKFSHW